MQRWVWQIFSSDNSANVNTDQNMKDAIKKTQLALFNSKKTLSCVLMEIECAQSRKDLEIGFKKINNYLRYLLRVQPATENYGGVRAALGQIVTSEKFSSHLQRSSSLEEALISWKTDVVQNLSFEIQKYYERDMTRDKLDRELMQRYLPEVSLTKEEESSDNIKSQYWRSSKRRKRMSDSDNDWNSRKKSRHENHSRDWRKNICVDFQAGKCRRGKSCRFEHITS